MANGFQYSNKNIQNKAISWFYTKEIRDKLYHNVYSTTKNSKYILLGHVMLLELALVLGLYSSQIHLTHTVHSYRLSNRGGTFSLKSYIKKKFLKRLCVDFC